MRSRTRSDLGSPASSLASPATTSASSSTEPLPDDRREPDVAELDGRPFGLQGDLARDDLRSFAFVEQLAVHLERDPLAGDRDLVLVPLARRLLGGLDLDPAPRVG